MNKRGNLTTVEPIRELADVNAITEQLRTDSERTGQPSLLVWLIGINCGLRIGDILSLHVGNVLNAGGSVKDYLETREQKTGKTVKKKLPNGLKNDLRRYLKGRSRRIQEPLFVSCRNKEKAYSSKWASNKIKQAATEAGITQPVTTHTMRKTFAYRFYLTCINDKAKYPTQADALEATKSVLNHNSITTTRRYIGIEQEEQDAIIENMWERGENDR